jgi:hypothetical protein
VGAYPQTGRKKQQAQGFPDGFVIVDDADVRLVYH